MKKDQALVCSSSEFVEDMRHISEEEISFDHSSGTSKYTVGEYQVVIRPDDEDDSMAVVALYSDKQLPEEAEIRARLSSNYTPRPMKQAEYSEYSFYFCKTHLAEDKTGVLELFPAFTDEIDPRVPKELRD